MCSSAGMSVWGLGGLGLGSGSSHAEGERCIPGFLSSFAFWVFRGIEVCSFVVFPKLGLSPTGYRKMGGFRDVGWTDEMVHVSFIV